MKRLTKRVLAVLIAMLIGMLSLSGCSMEINDLDSVVAIFDNENIRIDEAKLYVYETQYETEESSQFMVLYYFGGYDAFWKYQGMWEGNLGLAMQKLYQTKLLIKKANEAGMTLTEEEKARADKNAEKFMKENPKVREYAGASEEDVKAYFEDNALANKFRLTLIKDVDRTFDQDEFRRKRVEGLSIVAKSTIPQETETETETESAADPIEPAESDEDNEEPSGEETEAPSESETEAITEPETEVPTESEAETDVPTASEAPASSDAESSSEPTTAAPTYSDEEKEANVEEALKDITDRLKKGQTIHEIHEAYENSTTVTVTEIAASAVSPSDARKDETKDYASYKERAWDMATGDVETLTISGTSSKTSYAIRMIDDDDADFRKAAEEEELVKRQDAMFSEKYAVFVKQNQKFHVYPEKLANVRYKGAIKSSITVTGDDYATLDESEESTEEPTTAEN